MTKAARSSYPTRFLSWALATQCLALPIGAHAETAPVRLERTVHGGAIELTLINDSPAPTTTIIELTAAENTGFAPAVIGRKFPHYLRSGESRAITTAVPMKKGKPAQFAYILRTAFGNPSAVPQLDYIYRLPFGNDLRGVIRPYSGTHTTSNTLETSNAVEIVLPTGSPVVAARPGVVIAIDGSEGEAIPSNAAAPGAYVSVLHDDGTWATYGWLLPGSQTVQIGDTVTTGQELGLSGSNPAAVETYFMFVVLKNYFGLQLSSIPIQLTAAGVDSFNILKFSGQVSPNLPPKYAVSDQNETPWIPSEALVPSPPPPTDWNDAHLSAKERRDLFIERRTEAGKGTGKETVSDSRPLFLLAIFTAILGFLGVTLVTVAHMRSNQASASGVTGGGAPLMRSRAQRRTDSRQARRAGEQPLSEAGSMGALKMPAQKPAMFISATNTRSALPPRTPNEQPPGAPSDASIAGGVLKPNTHIDSITHDTGPSVAPSVVGFEQDPPTLTG